jgi:hypothetical protein
MGLEMTKIDTDNADQEDSGTTLTHRTDSYTAFPEDGMNAFNSSASPMCR